jgi:hypothetical protein
MKRLAGLALCCCVGSTSRSALGSIQNNTSDRALTELAWVALKESGIDATDFELDTRIDALPEGGLQVQILCSTRADHILKSSVEVKGHGAPAERLIGSVVTKAARDLAVDCR